MSTRIQVGILQQDVTQHGGLGAVGQAEPRRAFEVTAGPIRIVAFSIALTPLAQRPGGRIHLERFPYEFTA